MAISAGGPDLLGRLLPALPADANPLVVVQHMPARSTRELAERLRGQCRVRVREAAAGDHPERGLVLIAPGDRHLEVTSGGLVPTDGPELHGVRPAADITMLSAARVYGRRLIGLVMTGMGKDGTAGLAAIRQAGGATYAQDRDSCLVFGMPRAAIEAGVVDRIVTLEEILAILGE